jgi:hypothetical protein
VILLAIVLAVAAIAVLGVISGYASPSRARVLGALSAAVTTTPGTTATIVPRSFLGTSAEYGTLSHYGRWIRGLRRVLSLQHVPGNGPLLLRIGGGSADLSVWNPRLHALSPWAIDVTPGWVAELRRLLNALDARVVLDLNLVTGSPGAAADWVAAARRNLPQRAIAGLEIGNEPDLYDRQYWLRRIVPAGMGSIVPPNLSPASYARRFNRFASVLSSVAPGVPLLGPAVGYPVSDRRWIAQLLARPHPGLGTVSGHWYTYSACAPRDSAVHPTIGRLLSERATAGAAARITPVVRLAHRAGLPFRLTEFNSVSCGGTPGVSNSFATALWAPDALFELLRAGVDGVDPHLRVGNLNAPFALSGDGLDPRPVLYGLILFARALAHGAQLFSLHARSTSSPHLKAWGVRTRSGALHVLLIDKGPRAVRVDVRLRAGGAATVQRLLAPSPGARSGVTLAGQRLGRRGEWQGRLTIEHLSRGVSGYQLTLRAWSAALLDVAAPGRAIVRPPDNQCATLHPASQGHNSDQSRPDCTVRARG